MAQLADNATGMRIDNASTGLGAIRGRLMDATGNPLQVQHASARQAAQEALPMAGLNDANYRHIHVDRFGNVGLARPSILMNDQVEGATLNAYRWTSSVATMTQAQTATGINMNSGASLAVSTYSIITSARQFAKLQRMPLLFRTRLRIAAVANSQVDFGFGAPATTAAPANGAFWMQDTTGALYPAISFNGGGVITGTPVAINNNNYYVFDIMTDDDSVRFTCQDSSTGLIISEQVLQMSLTQTRLWAVTHLPAFFRVFNSASAPASAPTFLVSDVFIGAHDVDNNKTWEAQMSGNNAGSLLNPTAFTQTAAWTNSTEVASAALSNTAASYATLGGRFQVAATAGSVADYCLFGFQVPAPYTLFVRGVYIDTTNMGAAGATTGTVLEWALGTDSTAVSLATTSYLRRPLGKQVFAVGAAIGAQAAPLNRTFQVPIKCDGGKFFSIILRVPLGTATTSELFNGLIDVDGWFE